MCLWNEWMKTIKVIWVSPLRVTVICNQGWSKFMSIPNVNKKYMQNAENYRCSGIWSRSVRTSVINRNVGDIQMSSRWVHLAFRWWNRTLTERNTSVCIALGYGIDGWGSRVRFPVGMGIFLFTTACRTTLGPTQPPIQWVLGAPSLGLKRLGREADHSPLSSTEFKEWVELYLQYPNTSLWSGAWLSTGTFFYP
jgi:hypothetical protein